MEIIIFILSIVLIAMGFISIFLSSFKEDGVFPILVGSAILILYLLVKNGILFPEVIR